MAKASPAINAFNSGEWSPLMDGRTDLQQYGSACKILENFIPSIQGPAVKRGGTRFVSEVKDSTKRTWLVHFVFNQTQAYILEFGDSYIRFYANHGVIGAPYELATPYTSSVLTNSDGTFGLDLIESNDVIYIACKSKTIPVYKLARLSDTNWTLTKLDPKNGPMKDLNVTTTTVYYTIINAFLPYSVNQLIASDPIFSAGHVGSLFYLATPSDAIRTHWSSGASYGLGAYIINNGVNYRCTHAGTAGTAPPTHAQGFAWDGDPATSCQWIYNDPDWMIVKITAFTDPNTVTISFQSGLHPLPALLCQSPTTNWKFGLFSDFEGWPTAVALFKERLILGRDNKIAMSVSGDYENFQIVDNVNVTAPDMSVVLGIASTQANYINWLEGYDSLLVGTNGGEFAVQPITVNQVFGPGNVTAPPVSYFGSNSVKPIKVNDSIFWPLRSGEKLSCTQYNFMTQQYETTDKTKRSDHILRTGSIQGFYQQEDKSIIGSLRKDGQLALFTFNKEDQAEGWFRYKLAGSFGSTPWGVVESAAVIPAPSGDHDELWMIVKRTINGATKRYVEYLEQPRKTNDDPEDSFYVDCGLTLNQHNYVNMVAASGNKGDTNVLFTAGGSAFSSGDIGKEIHYRYSIYNADGSLSYLTAKAIITSYVSATQARCTIATAFPLLTMPSGSWQLTVTTVTGLSHLEGQTVQVLAGGSSHPDCVVSSGSITLNRGACKVHVGLRQKAKLQPLRLNMGAQDGTSQGKLAKINRCTVRLFETVGLKYGRTFDNMDEMIFRNSTDPMDQAVPLFSGDKLLDFPGDWDMYPYLCFEHDEALPCTIIALFPQVSVSDR